MTAPARPDLRALLAARVASALKPDAHVIPRRPDPEAPAPLTAAQRAMWLLSQYDPDSPAYNVPFVLRFTGALDAAAMTAAVRGLADLHPVLRSTVTAAPDGSVRSLRRAPDSVPVEQRTVTADQLDQAIHDVLARPFDLARDVPLRGALLRVTADDHVLVLAVHHIAADAYSRATILDDLARGYAAALGGPAPRRPEVTYEDYAAWRAAKDDSHAEELDWWAARLAGLPPLLELPTARPHEQAGWRAREVPLVLDGATAERVRAFAASAGCSPFMVVLTVLQVLLGRLSGSDDIPVGVPEAGRHHPATQGMIGCFLNTLVIRTDLSGEPTWYELLSRVRDTCLDAFAHAETPFGDVVAHLRPERPAGTTPLFQVMLNVFDAARTEARFPGLTVEERASRITTAKFDLAWHLVDHGPEGLKGALVYRAELFDAGFAVRLTEWFHTLLRSLLDRPDQPLSEVTLGSVAGPATVGPALERPVTDPVHRLVEQWAERTPDAVAVVGSDATLTYAELDRAARDVARRVTELTGGARLPVGVMMERGSRLTAALLGVLKAGAPYVAVDPAYPARRTRRMLTAAGARVLLTDGSRDAGEDYGVPHVLTLAAGAPAHAPGGERETAPVRLDDPVYVLFTSGSTGEPKGVVVEHRHLAHYLGAFRQLMGGTLDGSPSFALVSTIAADLGLTNVFGALTGGGTLHMPDRETATDPAAYAAYLATHRVDAVKMVPSHLEMLAAHGDLAALLPKRLLVLAGEPCPWQLVDRIREARPDLTVHVHYGPTETTVSVLGGDVRDVPAEARRGAVPLGRPLAGVRCHVVDRAGHPLPVGVPGELWIGGPSVSRGYLGREDLTAERFVADPVTQEGVCYRTGDRVRVREDGLVEFLGRLDDQVKVRGFRVELTEVASALRDVPGVEEAVVLPVGEAHDRRLAAWTTGPADPASVREALRGRLPDYMVPATVTPLAALPLNPNGKVDRAALPVPAVAADRADREPPATPTEKHVAQVWRRVLDVPDVGAQDDFFALGGTSFQAVLAVRDTHPSLRVIDLFTHPTVRGLSALLDRRDRGRANGTATPSDAPTPMLHRLGSAVVDGAAPTLVCLPYAGGSAAAYQPLAEALGVRAAVLAAELPGHDPAAGDQDLLPLDAAADLLADEITGLGLRPVLYGHSAGAALATAVALRLQERGTPARALVVGAKLPDRGPEEADPSEVTDEAYLADLRTAGALPADADGAFLATVLRALRHDAQQARDWFDRTGRVDAPLTSPVLCVVGDRDEGTAGHEERHHAWLRYAPSVTCSVLPGGDHYFLKHRADALASLIAGRLAAWYDVPPHDLEEPHDDH
ncbi:amino acid adenylation domain-containing protein [Streptomyces sp. NPDC126499]|uniref:non-ribosomal peptide synthetase n=1 Tax=Streptomyces sp. NPDC126499 TaxID=3155314 RepID=UPI00331BEA24